MRAILHSDLNNFYASVECVYDPSLRGRPIAVCGDPNARHGIILAKNDLAKSTGIKTGEVIWKARQKCPDLLVVSPDMKKYIRFSKRVRAIYADYTHFIEPFGLDEAWLDVSHNSMGGEAVANQLRQRVKDELGVTLSIGVSFNKIFAKLGSDMKKPDATTVISPENFREKIWGLPAQELLYVGPATTRKLCERNIYTIGDIARCKPHQLRQMLGKCGEMLWMFANGLEQSPVAALEEEEPVKSVGNSTTPPRDLCGDEDVRRVLTVLSESVAERLRAQTLCGEVVCVSVRDCELNTFSCQRKLQRPTALASEIMPCAMSLFCEHYTWNKPIRSLGVSVSALRPLHGDEQLSMFPDVKRHRMYELENAIGDIRRRFGHYAILRGSLIADEIGAINPRDDHVVHPVGWKNSTANGGV